jgi:hypothetical protein
MDIINRTFAVDHPVWLNNQRHSPVMEETPRPVKYAKMENQGGGHLNRC